ncbi:hypothetical protein EZV62_014825 [Acer yangbiense]|uniref:Uncharacterized protein n=1 Tax=Acer yangbiense TaxID=1000413 RepID=A0A5C7HVM8_9ROSI|nr:hypothetical protein EZV62_014825 [Acer yangbiense]
MTQQLVVMAAQLRALNPPNVEEESDGDENLFAPLQPRQKSSNMSYTTKKVNHTNQHNKVEGTKQQAHNFSFQTCKVTYGGVDGAYYTSTRTRRAGSDGAVFEESNEADRTTGQAAHRISRGIHDKGHSVSRKLNSDGKVDTMQTLHNLNEDELNGFEEAWKGNVKLHMPGWRDESDKHNNACYIGDEQKGKATWGSRLHPSAEQARNFGGTMSDDHKARTTARINIE